MRDVCLPNSSIPSAWSRKDTLPRDKSLGFENILPLGEEKIRLQKYRLIQYDYFACFST
jgi:hypothetical protein